MSLRLFPKLVLLAGEGMDTEGGLFCIGGSELPMEGAKDRSVLLVRDDNWRDLFLVGALVVW